MKIIRLEAENVKRLKAIEITPKGNLITIGGKNDQGKSSAIDCIDMAFSGASAIPPEPIRRGEESARIVVETEDLIITRTFTLGGGGGLRVGTKDGKFYTGPQGVLDPLVGQLAFDPLEFMNKKPADQVKTLKELTGLDFTKVEEEKTALYEKRKEVNKAGKEMAGALKSITRFPDAPKTKISVTDLMTELQRREGKNALINADKCRLLTLTEEVDRMKRHGSDLQRELTELEGRISRAAADINIKNKQRNEKVTLIAGLKTEDEDEIKKKIFSAEELNREYETEEHYTQTEANVERLRKVSKKLSDKLAALDHKQKMQLATAKFPIKGLSFDENSAYFNEIPIEQLSTSEKLKVSASMGFAMNPELRVLLIREGACLDADNRKLLAKMAEKNDTQAFLEVVGEEGDVSVIIEDGEVKGRAKPRKKTK